MEFWTIKELLAALHTTRSCIIMFCIRSNHSVKFFSLLKSLTGEKNAECLTIHSFLNERESFPKWTEAIYDHQLSSHYFFSSYLFHSFRIFWLKKFSCRNSNNAIICWVWRHFYSLYDIMYFYLISLDFIRLKVKRIFMYANEVFFSSFFFCCFLWFSISRKSQLSCFVMIWIFHSPIMTISFNQIAWLGRCHRETNQVAIEQET